MPARLVSVAVAAALVTAPAKAEEDCPKRFRDYGLFLQAKKSCARDETLYLIGASDLS